MLPLLRSRRFAPALLEWPTAEAVVGDLLELAREPAWRASGAFLEENREPCNARGGRAVPGIASRVP